MAGFAQYKGRRYRVLGTAKSKFVGAGDRVHLQFMDQTKDFWTDLANVDLVGEGEAAPFRPTGPPPNRADVDAAHAKREADARRAADRAAAEQRAGLRGDAAAEARKEADAQREARAEAERAAQDAKAAHDAFVKESMRFAADVAAEREAAREAAAVAAAEIARAVAEAGAARAEALAIRNEMAGLRATLGDARGVAAALKLTGAALDTQTVQTLAARLLDTLHKAGIA